MRLLFTCALLAAPMITTADTMNQDGQQMTIDDVIALADLDGDPQTITADEKDMIALLTQILGAQPVRN